MSICVMRAYFHSIIFLLLFVQSCDHSRGDNVEDYISSLDTPEKQAAFLEDTYRLDQKVRADEKDAITNYGYGSQEHKDATKSFVDTDQVLLERITIYLDLYGHPQLEVHGTAACRAPYIVLHHAPGEDVRRKYFSHLYKAALAEDLDWGTLAFFLNRMHNIRYGSFIEWNGPFRLEQELDTLYQTLELEDMIEKIEVELKGAGSSR